MKSVKRYISTNDIDLIEMKIKEGSAIIYESQNEDIEISGEYGNCSKGIEVKKYGRTVCIKQRLSLLPFRVRHSNLFIGIPATFNKSISIQQSTGKLMIKKITIESLMIKTSAAQLIIDDIVFEALLLKGGTMTSMIDLKRPSGNMDIVSNVGKVHVSLYEIGGHLTYKGGTMGGVIKIPSHAPVKIITSGNKGCKVNARCSEDAIYNFKLKPHVGNIKVVERV